MKKYLFFILLCIPLSLSAQLDYKALKNDPRFAIGKVPEMDGKVVFTMEIDVPEYDKDQIYEEVLAWVKEYFPFSKTEGDIIYQDSIGFIYNGEEMFVFSDNMFNLDRALMNYCFTALCKDGRCEVMISDIIYGYGSFPWDQDASMRVASSSAYSLPSNFERLTAEETITDGYAFTRRGRMIKEFGKFRISTILFVEQAFEELRTYLDVSVARAMRSSN